MKCIQRRAESPSGQDLFGFRVVLRAGDVSDSAREEESDYAAVSCCAPNLSDFCAPDWGEGAKNRTDSMDNPVETMKRDCGKEAAINESSVCGNG